ncbi:hypothetical protein BH11CYA1_BH11CYA1_31520 [soil metagenome]
MRDTHPESATNPNQYRPKGEPASYSDGRGPGGAPTDQAEANDLLHAWICLHNADTLKKQNAYLEGGKLLPTLSLDQGDIPLPKEKPDSVLSAYDRAMKHAHDHDIARVTAMGDGIHDAGNGITITKVGAAEIISRGNDQVAIGADGQVFTSEGAKISAVRLEDTLTSGGSGGAVNGSAKEGIEVNFDSGLRVVIYNGHIVQYGVGGMSYPSQYRVIAKDSDGTSR